MIRLPRTLRLDASDTLIYERAAEPGEWAVPGSFRFWDDDPAALTGRRRQAFRGGFLGLGSFGWSTLVEIVETTDAALHDATDALAAHLRAACGAPDEAAALAAAREEIAFARSLCDHPTGTVLAMTRRLDPDGAIREQFRTLHRRERTPDITTLPVFGIVAVEGEDEPVQRPDLAAMTRVRP